MEKRYGLPTAICMVVGIVIGSGVFFKAEKVLQATKGNMPLGILAWGIVGAIMIICSYVFATMATRYEKVSGLVDYAEATVGRRYAYYVGWFMAVLYTPCLVSALAWISARYFCVLLGWDITGGACMTIAGAMLCLDHVLNALAPRLAGRFQVSTTVIKMIPLALMAACGAAVGMMNGRMAENFATMSTGAISTGEGLMASTVAVAFAYEGWILATSINAELRDAKRTLPRALVVGSFIVVLTYILYYIGLTGAVTTEELMASGEAAAKMAFQRVFGETAGTVVFVVGVVVSLAYADRLIDLLTAMGRDYYEFVSIAPQEKLMQYFRVSILAGVVVTVPVAFYHIYAFAKPGLKKSESFFFKMVMLLGLILFCVGVLFAYKLMMPFMLRFLSTGIEGAEYIQTTTSIESYVNLCLTMFIIFGCVFEMPLITIILSKMGIINPQLLKQVRGVAIVIIFFIAAVVTPPDIVSQCMVAGPMVLLYFISIFLSGIFYKPKEDDDDEDDEDEDEE